MNALARVTAALVVATLLTPDLVGADTKPPGAALKVHVISGSAEYKSEESLKAFQKELEKAYKVTVTASWGKDGGKSLDNLDALKDAELLILFARRMSLPEDQMKLVRAHWEAGKPVVGIRTAGHAFGKDDNELFDRKVLGGHYKGHYGNEPVKVANVGPADHPVLKGVGPFTSRKLYSTGDLASDIVVLQTGDIGKAKHPVTIAHEYKGGRTVFTSLGVPEDFQDENFRLLLTNAVFWAAHRDPAKMRKE